MKLLKHKKVYQKFLKKKIKLKVIFMKKIKKKNI